MAVSKYLGLDQKFSDSCQSATAQFTKVSFDSVKKYLTQTNMVWSRPKSVLELYKDMLALVTLSELLEEN